MTCRDGSGYDDRVRSILVQFGRDLAGPWRTSWWSPWRCRRPLAPIMGGSLSFLGTSPVDAVTGGAGWMDSSGEEPDVCRTPRLVERAALNQEVGVRAEGEGGNLSSGSGGRGGTPRLVVWSR